MSAGSKRRTGRVGGRARHSRTLPHGASGGGATRLLAPWTPPLKHTITPPSKSRKHGGKPGRR